MNAGRFAMGKDDTVDLDLTGLNCPLPVLMLRRELMRLPAGARIALRASDPLAKIDIPHFCNEEGHDVLSQDEQDGMVRFEIRKGR